MGYLNKFVVSRSSAHIYRRLLYTVRMAPNTTLAKQQLLDYVEGFLQGFDCPLGHGAEGLRSQLGGAGGECRLHIHCFLSDALTEPLGSLAALLAVLPSFLERLERSAGVECRIAAHPVSPSPVGVTLQIAPTSGQLLDTNGAMVAALSPYWGQVTTLRYGTACLVASSSDEQREALHQSEQLWRQCFCEVLACGE